MAGLKRAANKQAANANVQQSGRLAPIANRKPQPSKLWEFSFRFYRQVDFFGFDGAKVEPLWLVSLMDRLAQLGKLTIEECVADPAKAQAYRLHPIDWKGKNVPISRTDLDWIDKVYLDDDENYPMRQFSVSTARGRVVGFFDENETFQVVLLDPLHNIQPSKLFNYTVDPCGPLACEITQLRAAIEAVLHTAPKCECGVTGQIQAQLNRRSRGYSQTILLTPVSDEVLQDVSAAMELTGHSYSAIFAAGVESVVA